jgi:protein-S-isoprenylcysteine O-methyltransferase Ste14
MAGVVVAVIAVFLIGVLIGAVAAVAVAIRREDRVLTGQEPDRLDRYARRLNGLGRRDLHVPGGPLPH